GGGECAVSRRITWKVWRACDRFKTLDHLYWPGIMIEVLGIPATDPCVHNRHVHISQCTRCAQGIHLVLEDVIEGDGIPMTRWRIRPETVLPVVGYPTFLLGHIVLVTDQYLHIRKVFG